MDLTLNNLQSLTCYKTQTTNQRILNGYFSPIDRYLTDTLTPSSSVLIAYWHINLRGLFNA